MRVVLRNPFAADGRDYRHLLTVGREYEVIGLCADDYQLLEDGDAPSLFDPCCFEVTDPAEPSFWVCEVGADGERYAHPAQWSAPGYFEDWHDGVAEVVAGFWADLPRLYPWTAETRLANRRTRPDGPGH